MPTGLSAVPPGAGVATMKKSDDHQNEKKKDSSLLPVAAGASMDNPTRMSKRNILKKIMLDQFCSSPINNALFLIGMGILGGLPFDAIFNKLSKV